MFGSRKIKMDSHRENLRKIKTSGSFKRRIKQNFLRIYNSDLTAPHETKKLKIKDQSEDTTPAEAPERSEASSLKSKENNTAIRLNDSNSAKSEFPKKQDTLHYKEPKEEPTNQSDEEGANHFEDVDNDLLSSEMIKNIHLLNSLRTWAVTFNIKQNALKELLEVLNTRLSNVLPRDPRTLVKTPQNVSVQHIAGGEYWHHGLKPHVEKVCSDVSKPTSLSLKINIDGLPIYRSSKDEFWPILFNIHEMPQLRPMIIGIYSGKRKPADVAQFLTPFVEEMEDVYTNGIYVNGHKISVTVRCFICDSPARAFVKGM